MEGKQSGQSENTIQHEICQDPLFTRKPYTSIKNNTDVVLHVGSNKHIICCPSVNTSDKVNVKTEWPSQTIQDGKNEKIRWESQDAFQLSTDINVHNLKRGGVKTLALIKALSLINPTLYLIGSKEWNTLLRLALSGRLPSKVVADSLFSKAQTALNRAVRRKEIQAILGKLRHPIPDPLSEEGSEAVHLVQQLWKLLYEELNESEYDEVFTFPLHEDSGASVFYQQASLVPGLQFTLTSTYFDQSWSTVRGVFSKQAVSKLIQTHQHAPIRYATHLQDLPKEDITTTDTKSTTHLNTSSSHDKESDTHNVTYTVSELMPTQVKAPRIRNDGSTNMHHSHHTESVCHNFEQQQQSLIPSWSERQPDFYSESPNFGHRVYTENYRNNNYPSLNPQSTFSSYANAQSHHSLSSSDSIVPSQSPSIPPSLSETLAGQEVTQQICSNSSTQSVPSDHLQSATHAAFPAPTDGTCSSDTSEDDGPFTSAVEETQPVLASSDVQVPNTSPRYRLKAATKNNVVAIYHNLDSSGTPSSLTKTSLKEQEQPYFGCNIHKWLENGLPYSHFESTKSPLEPFFVSVSDHNSPPLTRQISSVSSHSSESDNVQPPPSLPNSDSGVQSSAPTTTSSYSSISETSVGREETQPPGDYSVQPVVQPLGLPPLPPQHNHIDHSSSPEPTEYDRAPFLVTYGPHSSDITEHTSED